MADARAATTTDRVQRDRALDVTRSFIVQAPAGSGKTELLIQRFLSLLAHVNAPEEILAITFTRKAAAEMRVRLIDALERAVTETPPAEPHKRDTWERAGQVLDRDRLLGWNLRENPSRLGIMTIDSFCLALSRRMPWLARLGEQPLITEDADLLYRRAATNLLSRLETDSEWGSSLEIILQHLDNRLSLLRDLLIEMLSRRDQWLRYLIDPDSRSRAILESALSMYVGRAIESTAAALGDSLCAELTELAVYAAQNLEEGDGDNVLSPFVGFRGVLPGRSEMVRQWLALTKLVLTGTKSVRKKVDVRCGFPAGPSEEARSMKQRMNAALETLAADSDLASLMRNLSAMPDTAYSPDQWQVLHALIRLLPLAVVELREVFRSTGEVDFIEIAGSARSALGASDAPEDLLLQLDSTLKHILVDEYQDTSFAQHDLLVNLTSGWEPGDGRTLFVVGDPMQSIYRFREADVGLFLKAASGGIGRVPLEPLVLTSNFRSRENLVDWFNRTFRELFPPVDDILTGAVPYKSADAVGGPQDGNAVSCRLTAGRADRDEAENVIKIIQAARRDDPDGSIAVLVRSRTHLLEVLTCLKNNDVAYQAQDLDLLSESPVALDINALTRAVLHPGDRVAWLSLLRAPWCGLSLDDLLGLVSQCGDAPLSTHILEDPQQYELFGSLSPDGRERLLRLRGVLAAAVNRRGRVRLRRLIESTWLSLGGPAVVDDAGLSDAEQVFALIDRLDEGGDLASLDDLETGLGKLYAAPDPAAGPGLQVMTIHKAKGLEFDTVILPGLGRPPRRGRKSLLRWLEHPDFGLLLAPIPSAGADEDDIYRSLGGVMQQRDDHETLRLFYVAATRAKKRLYLMGHLSASGETAAPQPGSLLASAWNALSGQFEVTEAPGDEEESVRIPLIRRLPAGWQLPGLAAPVATADSASVSASEFKSDADSLQRFSLRTDEGRLVGTVVHRCLEKLAGRRPEQRQDILTTELSSQIRTDLMQAGIPSKRLDACVDKVRVCLEKTLSSDRGRWILSAHDDQAVEVALSGRVGGQLVHGSIDRTFVSDDVRWVIDYKTAAPSSDESSAAFLERQSELYRSQVRTYMALYAQLDPSLPVRGGLYFPMIDGWREIEL